MSKPTYKYFSISGRRRYLDFDEMTITTKLNESIRCVYPIRREDPGYWKVLHDGHTGYLHTPYSDEIEKLYQQYLADKAVEEMLDG